MQCENKAVTEAAARMRASREKSVQGSTAGARAPAATDKQPATHNAAGTRGYPRAASSSKALVRAVVIWTSNPK